MERDSTPLSQPRKQTSYIALSAEKTVDHCQEPVRSLLPPVRVTKVLPLLSIIDAKKLFHVALANKNALTVGFFSSENLIFFVFLLVINGLVMERLNSDLLKNFNLYLNFKNFSIINVFVRSGKTKLLVTLLKFDKKKFHLNQFEKPNFARNSTFGFCKNLVLDRKFIKIGFIKFDS